MCALGLGLGTSVDVSGSGVAAVVIEDYVFELSGGLQPRDIDYDFSDTWDVSATEIRTNNVIATTVSNANIFIDLITKINGV